MDEIYQRGGGYTIFPVSIRSSIPDPALESGILELMPFAGDWATVRVGDIALEAGVKFRVRIEKVRSVLERWLNTYPGIVAGIPTNERFITGGLAASQKAAVLRGFARDRSGVYVSHVRIHRDIRTIVGEKKKEATRHGNYQ